MRITLRLPAELHGRLGLVAKRDDRSLNSEIVHLLRQAIDPLVDADAYAGERQRLRTPNTVGVRPRLARPVSTRAANRSVGQMPPRNS